MAIKISKLFKGSVEIIPATRVEAVAYTDTKTLKTKLEELDATNVSQQTSITNNTNTAAGIRADFNAFKGTKGSANGICPLDSNSKVPASHLPGYVDDVIELFSMGKALDEGSLIPLMAGKAYNPDTKKINTYVGAFPNIVLESSANPEADKIYINKSTNKIYRWSGTDMVVISETIALGETSSTAYAGDKGKANATAIATLQTASSATNANVATNTQNINTNRNNISTNTQAIAGHTNAISTINTEIAGIKDRDIRQDRDITNVQDSLAATKVTVGQQGVLLNATKNRVDTIEGNYVKSTEVGTRTYVEIPVALFP